MKSLTPRQVQRREGILKAVREQLERYGYDGLNMRELADTAKVSPTTLYNLFESKDVLILAALKDLLSQLAEIADADAERIQAPGLPRFLARREAVANQIVETPRYAEAMQRMLLNAEPSSPIAKILLADGMQQHYADIREMQGLGQLRQDIDVELLARNLSGNGWATILLWMKGFIALQHLRREYVRSHVLTLLPVMTPKMSRQYQDALRSGSLLASAS